MEFLVPKLSATMERARVARWLKKVGDKVATGEPLVELETDKATMEVESPVDATLEATLAEEGADLPVGGALARLTTLDRVGGLPIARDPGTPTGKAAGVSDIGSPRERDSTESRSPRLLASPFAKLLAQNNGIELAGLPGAGARRLRKRDVVAAIEARGTPAQPSGQPPRSGFKPFSPMRAQIAAAVAHSRHTVPSFVLDRWVETTALDRARIALGSDIERAAGGRPTLTDFLLHALVGALVAHPALLDRVAEEDGRLGRVSTSTVDLGLVVALPDGMTIPVLHNLDGMTLPDIVQARRAAVERARLGRLLQSDFAPVAFALSNIGASGADRFEAIINPGQSGILAVGRKHERVISRSGGIAVASGVTLALTLDHRLFDGVLGGDFLATLAERIEDGSWRQA